MSLCLPGVRGQRHSTLTSSGVQENRVEPLGVSESLLFPQGHRGLCEQLGNQRSAQGSSPSCTTIPETRRRPRGKAGQLRGASPHRGPSRSAEARCERLRPLRLSHERLEEWQGSARGPPPQMFCSPFASSFTICKGVLS